VFDIDNQLLISSNLQNMSLVWIMEWKGQLYYLRPIHHRTFCLLY